LPGDWLRGGPLYDEFTLALDPGHRTEILGPLYFNELRDTQRQWGIPPLGMSSTTDPGVESHEFDLLYPVLTYDLYGKEYRWQIFQLFNFAGGSNQDESSDRRFTIFPIYFQQRSTIPEHNYTALLPIYGHLDHRLYRDEIDVVLFPLYGRSRRRDVVTINTPYPLFHYLPLSVRRRPQGLAVVAVLRRGTQGRHSQDQRLGRLGNGRRP
jgi:hypothetical protein